MDDLSLLTARLESLDRRWRWTATLAGILAAAALVGAVAAILPRRPDILRARGVVITDRAGNPRIVIGAPMADVTGDARLAETVGLVVLDPAGRLNVSVGANAPLVLGDGSVASRVAAGAGLTIYDPRNGGERGGFMAFADGRANVCLDYGEKPKEAACLSVAAQDAWAAVLLNGTPNESAFDRVSMYLGEDGAGVIKVFGGDANPGGLVLQAGTGPEARLVRYDREGNEVGEVPWKRDRSARDDSP